MTTVISFPQSVTYGNDASIRRFTVAEYERMIDADILNEQDQVELLEGYVVLKMARNPAHDGTIRLIQETFRSRLPQGWGIRVQLGITLSDSQPEPDIAIVRGDARAFLRRHPGPADVGLIIEVANTSLQRDLADKTRIYARASIALYWVIDLDSGRIEVFTDPSGPTTTPTFATHRTIQPPNLLSLALDGTILSIPAIELLP